MFSILHISDLHRSPGDPISNEELVSALLRDRDRYLKEDPQVSAPQAIVVSGDIIQGMPLRATDFDRKFVEQYAVAEKFLHELAKSFVNGDRSRVIIVPGNHDIDWNTAHKAMTLVGVEEAPAELEKALFKEDSIYRWNWKTRELYRIADDEMYASRFGAYRDFFRRFYDGVEGLLRVSHEADVNLFELHDGRIAVAAFNSCFGNDCFASHGCIPRSLIARTDLDLGQLHKGFELRIAVWHHSIEGPPYRTDYMDVDIVRGMIGRGFRLGLYGHQHKAQAAPHQIYLPDRETMAVVSAGSLCAGASELPPGINRQYSVIELADDLLSAKVHVREMQATNLFGRAALNAWGGNSFAVLSWEPHRDAWGRVVDAARERRRALVEGAEQAFKAGNYREVLRLLRSEWHTLEDYGRQLLLSGANEEKDWTLIITVTATPQSIEELVRRTNALAALGRYGDARGALDRFASPVGLPAAIDREIRNRLAVEERMRK